MRTPVIDIGSILSADGKKKPANTKRNMRGRKVCALPRTPKNSKALKSIYSKVLLAQKITYRYAKEIGQEDKTNYTTRITQKPYKHSNKIMRDRTEKFKRLLLNNNNSAPKVFNIKNI